MSVPVLELRPGRYDSGRRRQSKRQGREAGCWIYIPAEEIRRAGIRRGEPPPLYRLWGRARGSVLVRLYHNKRITP